MASSSSSHNYEVFLSFRGIDTRRNFTDHLYHALDRVGVRTFRDNEELKQGEEIGPELLKAIKESKISIPVFSENYASSKWCLKELAKIMDCRKTDGQVVLPIFYKVRPSDVRNQSGSFAQAFLEHEKKQSKETLDEWRKALSKVGDLSGWDSEDPKNSHEAEMIDSIVGKALSVLNKNTLEVAEHPIGMDSRVEEVLRLIDVKSKDVQFVGIHGIGGVGKTTLAKAIFNRISGHFEGCCFLPNVREGASQYKGLVNLQNHLISDILKRNDIHIRTVDEGINVIKERICSKKVLVILDDVDQDEHLNKLAGRRNWFGPKSTIIITTRDKHILDQVDECKIYMLDVLADNQSLQLFSNHAFRRHQPPEDFRELSEKFLGIIRGLPLALKVLGSFLRDKEDPTEWESALVKLNKIPDAKVQGSLQISYDGLEDEDKEIFLDISCFFIGMDKETVIHILEDNSPRIRIKVLVLKSLLRIDHDNKLTMHDLLRDMGREIVRRKNPKNLGKCSRLWSHKEALYVLKNCKGTQNVEGLLLNFGSEAEDRSLKVEAFKEMSELRLLQIDHAYLEGDFDHFPGELKWLSWKGLPSECTISHQEKLSVLDLSGGMITDDWSGWQHIQSIKTLKVLDLRDCWYLTRTPDFSHLTSLKRLILDGCEQLVVCHESIGQLKNLDFLSLKNCGNLVELPDSICKLSSVKSLILHECYNLERLPKSLGSMISLTELDIGWTQIGELPDAIGSLGKLEKLSLGGCSNLVKLPCSMGNLRHLHHFEMSQTGIVELPEDFLGLSSLKFLNLSFNKLQSILELPSSLIKIDSSDCSSMERLPELSNLKCLQELDLQNCKKLSEIQGISGLPLLQTLYLRGCTTLQSLPKLPSSLVTLNIDECISIEILPNLSNLKNLQRIDLDNCKKLVEIQGMKGLVLLKKLFLKKCSTLQSLPELPLGNLRELFIWNCKKLQSLPMLPSSLQELDLRNCKKLSEIQGISGLPLLQRLFLSGCITLQSLPKLPSSLVTLNIGKCISMEILPNLSNLKNLQCIDLDNCKKLVEIQGMKGLVLLQELRLVKCSTLQSLPELPLGNLRELVIRNCKKLRSLPMLPSSLQELDLSDCKKLSEIQGISGLPLLQTLCLSGCTTLQSLPKLPSSLVTLNIGKCISMEILPNLSNLKNLRCIDLNNCKKLVDIQGMKGLVLLQELRLVKCSTLQSLPELPLGNLRELVIRNCKKLRSLPMLPSSLIRLEAYGCISLERLPDMSNLKNLEALDLRHCNNLAEIQGLEGLESLISLSLYKCHTCVQNFPKIVAQGILPSASYEYDSEELEKQYLIPDDDNINGTVFFMVFKLPTQFSYDSSDPYDSSNSYDSSDFIYSRNHIPIEIRAEVKRNDGKRISWGISIRLEGWEYTDIGDQLYSCYFQGLTWFGIPFQKGDILKLSARPFNFAFRCDLDVMMLEFVVADEAMEDGQQLEKGVKHLITSILECEHKNHERAHSPYRMPSMSGGRREC